MTSRFVSLMGALLALTLLAAACGSDGADPIVVTSQTDDTPADTQPDEAEPDNNDVPIPVEPDGGIGDGAGPPPFAEDEAAPSGDWHGEQVAVTNCPGTDWQRVQAVMFSFSVPTNFVNQEVQGIDSEVALWSTPTIEVNYDFGWYSNPLDQNAGPVDITDIDYSGISGRYVVAAAENTFGDRSFVGAHFPEVELNNEVWDKLSLVVSYDDPADEIIGRCIVSSIDWNLTS